MSIPPVLAGMSMPGLSDIVGARLNVISFFLVGYLLLAWIYQRFWNSLRADLPKLPELSYRGALGALVVCGLFIYVILTMISGARELMTPGAWARTGIMYKLRDPEKDPKPWLDAARRASLERVRTALWSWAKDHENAFPGRREVLPETLWRSIDPDGLLLVYLPGAKPDQGSEVLVYEPGSFGSERLVLLSDGQIVRMALPELTSRVTEQIARAGRQLQKEARP